MSKQGLIRTITDTTYNNPSPAREIYKQEPGVRPEHNQTWFINESNNKYSLNKIQGNWVNEGSQEGTLPQVRFCFWGTFWGSGSHPVLYQLLEAIMLWSCCETQPKIIPHPWLLLQFCFDNLATIYITKISKSNYWNKYLRWLWAAVCCNAHGPRHDPCVDKKSIWFNIPEDPLSPPNCLWT